MRTMWRLAGVVILLGVSLPSIAGSGKDARRLTRSEKAVSRFLEVDPGSSAYEAKRNRVNKAVYRLRSTDQWLKLVALFAERGSTEDASAVATVVVDALIVRERWEHLAVVSKSFLRNDALNDPSFREYLDETALRATYKHIEFELARSGDRSAAAVALRAVHDEYPGSDLAAQALHNASVFFLDAGRVEEAMEACQLLVDAPEYGPKTKYYADQVGALGYHYERYRRDFDKAAKYYELYVSVAPTSGQAVDSKKVADALFTAAVFRRYLLDFDHSRQLFELFLARFPDHDRAAQAQKRLANMAGDRDRMQGAPPNHALVDFAAKRPNSKTIDLVVGTPTCVVTSSVIAVGPEAIAVPRSELEYAWEAVLSGDASLAVPNDTRSKCERPNGAN